MSKYVLRYVDLKEKGFNKKNTLTKFIDTKCYKAVEIYEKKDGVYHLLRTGIDVIHEAQTKYKKELLDKAGER